VAEYLKEYALSLFSVVRNVRVTMTTDMYKRGGKKRETRHCIVYITSLYNFITFSFFHLLLRGVGGEENTFVKG
jgi:hypothetical protein